MENKVNVFETLNSINVKDKVELKAKLSYLSWAWAWAETKKKFPLATYTVFKDENNLPYIYDENLGYMCFTTVTIEEQTLEMWLPVMDGANKPMKKESYTYSTRYGDKTVEPASMFDINKTIMRCLVKNLAMFGMALYIYAGEDLPEEKEVIKPKLNDEKLQELLTITDVNVLRSAFTTYELTDSQKTVLTERGKQLK